MPDGSFASGLGGAEHPDLDKTPDRPHPLKRRRSYEC